MGQCISQIPKVDSERSNKDLLKKYSSRRLGRIADASLLTKEVEGNSRQNFRLKERRFDGTFKAERKGKKEHRIGKSINEGLREFIANPHHYYAIFFPTGTAGNPVHEQEYVLLHRKGTEAFRPNGVSPDGQFNLLTHEYHPLKSFRGDIILGQFRDNYTDTILSTYKGRKLHLWKNVPLLPGRGMGCCDKPNIRIIGNVDPSTISQGKIGNCWLLSGVASLAEYDGAIEHLFRKTKNLSKLPKETPNSYTVTLYDLKTWEEVDIVVDERLCARSDGSRKLLGAEPTKDGELWVPYLEKAIAAHCGGWDMIDGGHCTHAWSLLTGVKRQFIVQKQKGTKNFVCMARYDTKKSKWAKHGNAPSDGYRGLWNVPWPGIGEQDQCVKKALSQKKLFLKMCQWKKANFLMGASSVGLSDQNSTDGIVDNHAYSVVECRRNVAGTGVDMIRVRNPWGHGKSKKGKFRKAGSGWKKYPEIKKELKPVFGKVDDGLFWLTRQEFFKYYDTVYVGACDMKRFLKEAK